MTALPTDSPPGCPSSPTGRNAPYHRQIQELVSQLCGFLFRDSSMEFLEHGISLNEFLSNFPTVAKAQAVAVIEIAGRLLSSKNISELYASAA